MNYTLQTEIEYVRENYYINESDAQSVRQFENEIQSLISVYDDILKVNLYSPWQNPSINITNLLICLS